MRLPARRALPAPPRTITLFWHQRNDTVPAQRWLRRTLVDLFATGENMAQDAG